MNKYDVLANLDIDSIENNSVKSWIDALSDGEYLSNYDYSETIVNDAVSILERLNKTTFTVCDQSGVDIIHSIKGFDALIEKLSDYQEYNQTIIIKIWGIDCVKKIKTTTIDYLDDLDIYQLIQSLDY